MLHRSVGLLLLICALVALPRGAAAEADADFLTKLFVDACVPNMGRPDKVRAWATKRRFKPITNPAAPSLQLAGTPDRSTLDLNALTDIGVKLVGRLAGITEGGKAQFAGSLRNVCALSDLKMGRLLDLFDEWARANGIDNQVDPPHRLPPTRVEDSPPLGLDSHPVRSRPSSGPPVIGPTIRG